MTRRMMSTALGWMALVLFSSGSYANPITVGAGGANPFQVDPLYFIAPTAQDPNPIGLVGPGNGVNFIVDPGDFAVSACGTGGGCDLSISKALITPVYQNPQTPASSLNPQTPPGTPTQAVPFVADSLWSVKNTSGENLGDSWLLFTGVDFTGGYPVVDVALDQNLYQVAQFGEGANATYYGVLHLGALADQQSTSLTIRYIVAGDLLDSGGNLVTPPLSISGVVAPEPASAALLGVGLAALARMRRGRCD